jgi:hypothetical protein
MLLAVLSAHLTPHLSSTSPIFNRLLLESFIRHGDISRGSIIFEDGAIVSVLELYPTVAFFTLPSAIWCMSGLGNRIRRATQRSAVGKIVSSLNESRFVSAVQAVGIRLGHIKHRSFVYQWLTKKPETRVITIDIREAWTTSQILRLVDRLVN